MATLVTTGTMATRLKSLEKRGLIVRSQDGQDRRGVTVTLTERGVSAIDSAFGDVLACQRALLVDLDEEEKASLETLLRTILRHRDDSTIFH